MNTHWWRLIFLTVTISKRKLNLKKNPRNGGFSSVLELRVFFSSGICFPASHLGDFGSRRRWCACIHFWLLQFQQRAKGKGLYHQVPMCFASRWVWKTKTQKMVLLFCSELRVESKGPWPCFLGFPNDSMIMEVTYFTLLGTVPYPFPIFGTFESMIFPTSRSFGGKC